MNLQVKSKFLDDRADPFHSYFDIQVVHQSTDNSNVQLQFNETRNAPFIMCPEKYFISIVRFNLSTDLPLFIPKLQLNQPNPNLTDYSMWIYSSSSAFAVEIDFTWVTQGTSPTPIAAPGPNFTTQDLSSDYYYCSSYTYFLELMNAQIKAALAPSLSHLSVWFSVDPSTLNLQLNFKSTVSDSPRFFFNSQLKNLFPTFPFKVSNVPSFAGNPQAFEIIWANIDPNNSTLASQALVQTSTCPFPNWNPISSIVFTTTTLPVVPSNETTPVVYGTNTQLGSVASNNNIKPVLTDFVVNVGPGSLYNPSIVYLPTAEYRLNDMYGNSPLTNLDLQVWWKDKYNNYHPLLIPSGGAASIKIMFRKKNFNTSSKNIIV